MNKRGVLTPFPLGDLHPTSISIAVIEQDQTGPCLSYVYMVRTKCCGRIVELTHKEVVRKVQKGRQAIKDGRPIPVCSRCKHKIAAKEDTTSEEVSGEETAYWPAPPLALSLVRQRQWWPR